MRDHFCPGSKFVPLVVFVSRRVLNVPVDGVGWAQFTIIWVSLCPFFIITRGTITHIGRIQPRLIGICWEKFWPDNTFSYLFLQISTESFVLVPNRWAPLFCGHECLLWPGLLPLGTGTDSCFYIPVSWLHPVHLSSPEIDIRWIV